MKKGDSREIADVLFMRLLLSIRWATQLSERELENQGGRDAEIWEKLEKTGKNGEKLGKLGKIGKNWEKLRKTGENW